MEPSLEQAKPKIGLGMAISLVVSSMVGTGVFTSLGYQLADLPTPFTILLLWIVGGVVAYSGAVVYAELGSAFPRSGGEYNVLGQLYHPLLGFLAGWVSATVGFAAPAAIAAIALAAYLGAVLPQLPQMHTAAFFVLAFNLLHGKSLLVGERFQNFSTIIKVLVMVGIVVLGFTVPTPQEVDIFETSIVANELFSAPFAIAMVYVFYAYTGWNSSMYVINDLHEPQRNLPKSMFLGTILVAGLYVLINYVFMISAPITELRGQIEVGFIVGSYLFGQNGASIIALLISALLLSTVSAYVFVGPRVMQIIGEDLKALNWLAKTNDEGIPQNAFLFSCLLSLTFIYTSTLDQVMVYTSFLLSMFTSLSVGGIFILRKRNNVQMHGYKAWGYPFTPILFLAVNLWVMVFVIRERPIESMVGLALVGVGSAIFWFTSKKQH